MSQAQREQRRYKTTERQSSKTDMEFRGSFLKLFCILLLLRVSIANLEVIKYNIQEGMHVVISDTSLRNITTARSLNDCLTKCQVNRCKSVNFDKISKECITIACVSTTLSVDQNKVYASREAPASTDCSVLKNWSCEAQDSGVYTVTPEGWQDIEVYCDMVTDGGGWTTFVRRMDGSVNFVDKVWADYRNGFGEMSGEHWLGLENLHRMTYPMTFTLRLDMESWENGEDDGYRFHMDETTYQGDAGGFSRPNGMRFTTSDKDQDTRGNNNCANVHLGGWWYSHCHDLHPTGLYLQGTNTQQGKGVSHYAFKGHYNSLKKLDMKFRPT